MKKKLTVFLIALLLIALLAPTASASPYYNYSFTYFGNEAAEPQAYNVAGTITGFSAGTTHFKSPSDIHVTKINGVNRIYITDTGNNRIVVLDENFKFLTEVTGYNTIHTKQEIWDNWPDKYKQLFPEEFADEPAPTEEPTPEVTPEPTPEPTPAMAEAGESEGEPEATESAEPTPEPTPTYNVPNPDEEYADFYTFKQPEGVFVEDNGNMYVCDTQNGAIVYFEYKVDGEGKEYYENFRDGIYDDPQVGMVDASYVYRPSKVVKDNSGRLYVLANNNTNGILQMTNKGVFVTYIGANKTTATAIQILTRTLFPWLTSQTTAVIPTEYNNITIDDEGFLYATIGTVSRSDLTTHMTSKGAEKGAPIRRLNAMGTDILRRLGAKAPVGDILALTSYAYLAPDASKFMDIAVDSNYSYTAIDTNRGRAFTYDYDGNLLYVFGGIGKVEGTFSAQGAVSIALLDDEEYLVLDSKQNLINYYKPTSQGKVIREAVAAKNARDYDLATEKWEEYLMFSSNSEVAYNNIGKLYLMKGRELYLKEETRAEGAEYFAKAMKAFKLAQERSNYSEAYVEYRRYNTEKSLPYVLTGALILIAAGLIFGYVRKYKIAKAARMAEIERRRRHIR